jgi:hypothetical protein
LDAANEKLKTIDSSLLDVLGILRDLMNNIGEAGASLASDTTKVSQDIDSSYKIVLDRWSETIGGFVSSI